MHWTYASFLAAFFGALYITLFSQLVKHENRSRNILHYMFYLYLCAIVCIGLVLYVQSHYDNHTITLYLTPMESLDTLGMGIAFVLSTYFFATAFRVAPNPAFVTSIANSNMLIVLALSLLAGALVKWQAVVGVLLTFVGLCILTYFSQAPSTVS